MICNESTKCCYTWECSSICLGMFLGLPPLQMAGWGGIYSLPHTSSHWIESSNFLSTGAPDSPVQALFTVRCLPRQSTVGSDRCHPLATWHTRQSGGAPDSPVQLEDRWLG
jgi:hypothetical protein